MQFWYLIRGFAFFSKHLFEYLADIYVFLSDSDRAVVFCFLDSVDYTALPLGFRSRSDLCVGMLLAKLSVSWGISTVALRKQLSFLTFVLLQTAFN